MPVYPMSCFRFPETLISKLNSLMANFWWGADSHKTKVHWLFWEKMCLPKHLGGMGFRDLECFNQALLAKQAWKILHQPDCLLSRFLKSRYFNNGEFLLAPMGDRPSYAWRSLMYGRELLQKGLRYRVGNGENTRVWLDKWIESPVEGLRAPWIRNITFDVNLMASSLIDPETKRWNAQSLSEVFVRSDVEILMRNQPVPEKDDFFSWNFNRNGQFTVKSAYWLASSLKSEKNLPEATMNPSLNTLKEKVWKVQTSPKIRVFLWKSLSEALPSAELISARGMKVDMRCQTCGEEPESINHMLFQCSLARQVWALSEIPYPQGGFDNNSLFANMNTLLTLNYRSQGRAEVKRIWPWILWQLWKRRNEVIFEGRVFNAMELVLKARQDAEEWFTAQVVEEEWQREERISNPPVKRKWIPPEPGWGMCNIGMEFDKITGLVGGGWVLRNERGVVLCHSRRAFSVSGNREDAKLVVIKWAIESMRSQRQSKIIFAGEFGDLFGATTRPEEWPSFQFQSFSIRKELNGIGEWKLLVVNREANRGLFSLLKVSLILDWSILM